MEQSIKKETNNEIKEAKQNEFNKWVKEDVIEEIEDIGQERLSTTWVITSKLKDGIVLTKTRLVARGYEETNKVRSDYPTCCRDSNRMLLVGNLAVAIGKDWNIRSLDVEAAFLQGNRIERFVFKAS